MAEAPDRDHDPTAPADPGIPDEPMTPRSGESFLAPPEESPPDGREKEPDQGDAADIPVPPPPD
jgi:hypothetical protein